MTTQPIVLFRLLVASLILGAALGLVYDAVRISRVMLGMSRYTSAATAPAFCPRFCVPRDRKKQGRTAAWLKNGILVVEDVLFCLTVGVTIALLLFSHNNGEFRGFVLVGLAVGFAAYYFTVGRLVIHASEYVVFAIKVAFLYAAYYLTRPFVFVGVWMIGIARGIRRKRLEKKIRRYTKRCTETLFQLSEKGFLV